MLKESVRQAADQIAIKHQLEWRIKFVEEFPATVNNREAVAAVETAAAALGLSVVTAG